MSWSEGDESGSGEWGETHDEEVSKQRIDTELVNDREDIHVTSEYITILEALQNIPQVDIARIRSIYVPGSGTDTSPSVVFPGAGITYLDNYEPAISTLRAGGFHAVEEDVNTYQTERPVDLVVDFNSNGIEDECRPLDSLAPGGLILDHHWGTSPQRLFARGDLEFLGVLKEVEIDGEIKLIFDDTVDAIEYTEGEISQRQFQKREEDRAFLFRKRFDDEEHYATFPDFFKKKYRGRGIIEYKGEEHKYAIIDRSLQPNLPNFIGYQEGKLFISDEVPDEFRPFMLRHEIREIQEMSGEEGRCVASLKEELAEVPEDIYAAYVSFRTQVFSDLVTFFENAKNESLSSILAEVRGSLNYLQNLAAV